ncbi:unnamed protein product [Lactuca saligna]|uniref:Uncharacterized protein n=1 Tax=Lactuca saligna TaxID=75948 RepID=A0AA35V500_LACSI|nr:unnamed protein product [Lactuca saligna]
MKVGYENGATLEKLKGLMSVGVHIENTKAAVDGNNSPVNMDDDVDENIENTKAMVERNNSPVNMDNDVNEKPNSPVGRLRYNSSSMVNATMCVTARSPGIPLLDIAF